MNLILIVSEHGRSTRYNVDAAATMGRDPSNDIVLDDPSVSLVHCQVHIEKGRAFIKDLGSTNGISLNGERLISSELRDGDGLTVGKSKIRVEMSSAGPATATGSCTRWATAWEGRFTKDRPCPARPASACGKAWW
jgi:pSer/pThr/pTyr-binding forkhead associated (FHA) protein